MAVTINGTTGVAGVDGSASTPAIQGGDTNTGVFFPAADTVAVSTNGTERMRVDSAGNVGIGTSSPSTYAAGGGTLSISQSSAGAEVTPLAIVNPNGTANTQVSLAFTPNTNIPLAKISAIRTTSGGLTSMTFGTYDGSSIVEAMRIDSSGNLLVGSTAAAFGYKIYLAPSGSYSSGIYYKSSSDNTNAMDFRNTSNTQVGSIYVTTSGTTFATSSDYRLKENIQPMQNALAKVAALKPVTYTWKADGSDGQGFIAHELQAVVPDCVTGEKDAVDAEGKPVYQGVDTSFLVATLAAAIQELNAKVETQAAEIAALKGN